MSNNQGTLLPSGFCEPGPMWSRLAGQPRAGIWLTRQTPLRRTGVRPRNPMRGQVHFPKQPGFGREPQHAQAPHFLCWVQASVPSPHRAAVRSMEMPSRVQLHQGTPQDDRGKQGRERDSTAGAGATYLLPPLQGNHEEGDTGKASVRSSRRGQYRQRCAGLWDAASPHSTQCTVSVTNG